MAVTARLVRIEDVPVLADLLQTNREVLAPWDPVRSEDYFTVEGHRVVIDTALEQYERGAALPHVIVDDGRIILNTIVRCPFQSRSLGYWVGTADNGRGVASAAVREIVRVAFQELGLHRVEVGTLLHNVAPQRVLERNGSVRFGIAPNYLNIAGVWQDHTLHQLVAHPDDT
ncbi:[SSU ribosomal protein S5P]-alanine acetyltransferase [Micromonospora pisi]|uniref:[SSU ribosomal protein S5P]-alanine acetyltransferase n=1 Tax=Micromonospora pisi TaxID=589240 RepID=A0A495JG17_9ACTN|nr:GNAT family protein [Micromonospora pisi]RKR87009.1 [SSU ribosomal protein S5P]-alanine acetyltransferase [Micromonospora pisi]